MARLTKFNDEIVHDITFLNDMHMEFTAAHMVFPVDDNGRQLNKRAKCKTCGDCDGNWESVHKVANSKTKSRECDKLGEKCRTCLNYGFSQFEKSIYSQF